MTASSLKSLGLILASCLSLAACENRAGMSEPGEPVDSVNAVTTSENFGTDEAAALKAAREVVYCARTRQHVTRAECRRIGEIWDNLEEGKAAIHIFSDMVRDEATTVSFAVSSESSETTIEEALGGETVDGSTEAVKIGGVMAARLTGQGFKIEPEGTVRKEIGPSGSMLWEWQVTPLKNHGPKLRVQAFVIVPGPNGTQQEIFLKTYSKDVKVKVTGGQRIADLMDSSTGWLTRGNNWLKALAGFLTALAALWAALKAFRPKAKTEPPA